MLFVSYHHCMRPHVLIVSSARAQYHIRLAMPVIPVTAATHVPPVAKDTMATVLRIAPSSTAKRIIVIVRTKCAVFAKKEEMCFILMTLKIGNLSGDSRR